LVTKTNQRHQGYLFALPSTMYLLGDTKPLSLVLEKRTKTELCLIKQTYCVYSDNLVKTVVFDPLSGLLGVVGEDDISAGTLEAHERLHDNILLV